MDVRGQDRQGRTALHVAVANGHFEMGSRSSLYYVKESDRSWNQQKSSSTLAQTFQRKIFAATLLCTCELTERTPSVLWSLTESLSASLSNRTAIVSLLLQSGVDPNQKDGMGKTPMSWIFDRVRHVRGAMLQRRMLFADEEERQEIRQKLLAELETMISEIHRWTDMGGSDVK